MQALAGTCRPSRAISCLSVTQSLRHAENAREKGYRRMTQWGEGGEGRLSYSALEGGVGRTLQLYLARAAAAAAAARCQPVTPSVHRARNKQESGCTCRALPAKYPYQLPPFNSPAKPRRRSVQTRKPRGSSASTAGGGCGATRAWLCGRHLCLSAASASALDASCNSCAHESKNEDASPFDCEILFSGLFV